MTWQPSRVRAWTGALVAGALTTTLAATLAPAPTTAAAATPSADARRQLVEEARAADSHCVTVVRDGRTLLARDLDKSVDVSQIWSITKSVTALLVGIAQDQRLLDVDDRVATYVPAWRGTPSRRVTIRHLLANTSGREWSLETDYSAMAGRAADKTRFSIRLSQEARPGTVWAYNNAAIQVLEAVLEKATRTSVPDFARTHLFRPLGMHRTRFQLDGAGNAMVFGGLLSTCRDLARLGVLLADDGRVKGRRVISARYLREATQRPSSELNAAYGLLFWINEPGPLLQAVPGAPGAPAEQGPMVPAAGPKAFWGIGLFGQLLFVSPADDVVAVRLGDQPPAGAPLSVGRFTELALGVAGR